MTRTYVRLSPRTAAEPMAFTPSEFWRGTGRAWIVFIVLLLTLEIVASVVADLGHDAGSGVAFVSNVSLLPIVLTMSLLIGGLVSALSLLIGVPLVRWMATALRREPRVAVHITAYALFGITFGGLIGGGVYALAFHSSGTTADAIVGVGSIAAALTSVAVTTAWLWTACSAIRDDRDPRLHRRSDRPDQDMIAEDDA